jgi:hypothetical protein
MLGPIPRVENILWKEIAVRRLGQNPQPLGQKQPLLAPMPLLAERTDALDQRIGKGGDLAGQGNCSCNIVIPAKAGISFFQLQGKKEGRSRPSPG